MKLVINAYSARQGGGQTYIRNLLEHLPGDGSLEVLVFAPESLRLPEHPNVRRVAAGWPTTNPILRTLWEKWRLPKFLRDEQADVLFCPGGVVATRAPDGCKVVTMFRNMTPFDPRAMSVVSWGLGRLRLVILRRVMLRSMRRADLTIFISEHARRTIEALASIPNPITIPHGIAEAFRADGRNRPLPEWIGSEPYLLYVSKFDTYKHHTEVVRAFALLSEAARARVRLILVGETDHPEAARTENLIAERGLTGRVIMRGAVAYDDLPAIYQNATANIFASSCENCPNILLEALAAGRPVLSSDVPPMPEFGGTAPIYFSPFDPESIARAFEQVLSGADTDRLGAAAQAQSHQYRWSATAARTWKAIVNVASTN